MALARDICHNSVRLFAIWNKRVKQVERLIKQILTNNMNFIRHFSSDISRVIILNLSKRDQKISTVIIQEDHWNVALMYWLLDLVLPYLIGNFGLTVVRSLNLAFTRTVVISILIGRNILPKMY